MAILCFLAIDGYGFAGYLAHDKNGINLTVSDTTRLDMLGVQVIMDCGESCFTKERGNEVWND